VTPTTASDRLLELVRCPNCRSRLERAGRTELRCEGCGGRTPIIDGIPRFVDDQDFAHSGEDARRTRASFGYEWTHFNDWKPSAKTFGDYFSRFDLEWLRGRTVLDAGCGMGRHARQIAPFAETVVAVDFSTAINEAARNVADLPNVRCLQGDLTRLPVADDTFDFVFSMGVLHHIADTTGTLRGLVRVLKPGGRMRLYLYWKRTGFAGMLLSVVSFARKFTTRLPFPLLRLLCWLLSVVLTIGVILPYRLMAALGLDVRETWPLALYVKHPFNVLYNDQFDRFSAPIEKRFSEAEVRALLESVGLHDISVHSRYGWIGDGVK
jgi:SAM-dependent methyltransferase